MNINTVNSIYVNSSGRSSRDKSLKKRFMCTKANHGATTSKENTSIENIKNRPTKALSFGGSVDSTASKLGKKFINNSLLNKTIGFVYDNEAAYNAIYSLVVAGMLKPVFVLSMPGSEEKDKQIVATKNFLQAFIGSFLGLTIGGGIVKKAVDVIENNLKLIRINDKGKLDRVSDERIKNIAKEILTDENIKSQKSFGARLNFAKQQASTQEGFSKIGAFIKGLAKKPQITDYQPTAKEIEDKMALLIKNVETHLPIFNKNEGFVKELLKNPQSKTLTGKETGQSLMDAYKTCWKNSTGFITTIGKAKISSLLLPSVMAVLFAKRNLEKKMEEHKKSGITLTTSPAYKNEQKTFAQFMSKPQANKEVSFKGDIKRTAADAVIDNLAQGVERISMSKFGEKGTRLLSKFKKQSARMSDLESILLTVYWVQNTARSKKIDPDQKLGLNVHTILVTVVSSLLALAIDTLLDGPIDKLKETYKAMLQKAVDSKDTSEVKNVMNSKKFISQIDYQDNVTALAQEYLKGPNVTLDKAKEVIGDIDVEELTKYMDESKGLSDIASKIKEFISTNTSPDSIKEFLADKNIKVKKGDFEELLKQTDAQNILKTLGTSLDKDIVERTAKLYGKQLSKFKSLTIFTFVVRFLVPVIMVPISGKIKKKVVEYSKNKKEAQPIAKNA